MSLHCDYELADEATLQDALAGRGELAAMREGWIADLNKGDVLIAHVPGEPARALVLKTALERLLGQPLPGPEVMAIPFA